ncbi:MAG: hypothetical protein K2J10_02385, partial [Muribaculaceae bacterium]|nr:hypothetical protein [Muribaculaceae bacterium]
GKLYSVKMRFTGDYPCTFEVTYGSEATAESQVSATGHVRYEGDHYLSFELPAEAAGGDFHIGIHAVTSSSDDGWLYLYSVDVAEAKDGSIDLHLINGTTQEPISDVTMNLSSPTFRAQSASTNGEGHATFGPLTPGDYTLTYYIDGFVTPEPLTITVGDNEEVAQEIAATPLSLHSVTGNVVDFMNRPLSGVNVELIGSRTYTATTDAMGKFTFEDVRCPEQYIISINQLLYQTYSAVFDLPTEDLTLDEIRLENFFGKPANVTCDNTEAGLFVSWLAPVGKKEFKYDNGEYQGMHTVQGNYIEYVRFGVKFDEPMIVEDISWVVCDLNDGMVDLAIYPLTPDGAISTVAAFEVKGVPSETYRWTPDMEWQKYHLETPVEMPYGCLVSVGHAAGGMNMALDYRNNWGPSYTGKNDLADGWDYANISNFLIRANGTVLSRDITLQNRPAAVRSIKNAAPAHAPMLTTDGVAYKVWRFDSKVKDEPEWWTLLSGKTNGLYAIDTEYESLEQGEYIYAVQAINYDGTESEITMSQPVRHNMTTDLTVRVFTDTAIDFADGATVTLTNNDTDEVFEGVVTDNSAKFIGLPKGVYSMRVKRSGFYDAVYGNLNYNSNSEYTAYVDLTLIAAAPFSLQATQADGSRDVLLEWNKATGIFDDFESMPDFEVNPAGDHGWTYADLDESTTYGVAQCQQTPYPNMHAKMAFMAFNPYATTPDISTYVQPFSGEKVLISVSLENGGRNNDYMFSPELKFDTPFTVRFQACAGFYGSLGRERFMVGYTTEGTDPESVTWLTTEPESVGGLWTEFSYTMPAEARHAVIRCVSDQTMFFMIDDLFIGREEDDIFAMTSFRVYLDDELAGTTSNRAFSFTDLDEGKHLAKVQTVYQMADMNTTYSDFTELLFTVAKETTGINDVKTEELYTYSAASMTLTAGASAAAMTVYDMQGRVYGNGQEISFTPSDKGIYLIYVTTTDGRVVVRKLAI